MRWALASVLVLGVVCATELARAQSDGPLEAAEQAYRDVDFVALRAACDTALESGALDPRQLVRAHMLAGVAALMTGDEPAAHAHFVALLALDREARLPTTIPPRLQGPFLEARGVVDAQPAALDVEVSRSGRGDALALVVHDPLRALARVRISVRASQGVEALVRELDAAAELVVPIAELAAEPELDWWIEGLDAHGNRALVIGSASAPRVLRTGGLASASSTDAGSLWSEPALWITVGAVIVVGAALTVVGVVVDQERQPALRTLVTFGSDRRR